MELHRIRLTREQLDGIPENERAMLILFCHAMNELGVLVKIFHWSSINRCTTDIESKGSNSIALTVARLLCGKIFECWELIRKSYYRTAISREYHDKLDQPSKNALGSLSTYFSRPSIIRTIRNRHAFHYAPDQLTKAYEEMPKYEDELNLYLSESNLATLYFFADLLANGSMLADVAEVAGLDGNDPAAALQRLKNETVNVVGLLNHAISGCISVAIQKHLGQTLEELGAETIELQGLVGMDDVSIPFFVEDDGGD